MSLENKKYKQTILPSYSSIFDDDDIVAAPVAAATNNI
jgi:hypothetical protein